MEKNIVVAASGLKAAAYLKERYGTPYECADPLIADVRAGLPLSTEELYNKRILVVHQQVRANALREALREETKGISDAPEITAATWFSMFDEIAEEVRNGNWDIIIADGSFRKAAGDFGGRFIELPHFAVSGHFADEESVRFYT